MFHDWKSLFREERLPERRAERGCGTKGLPCANVIALHVVSAWRARLSTLAVVEGETPFIIPDMKRGAGDTWNVDSARSRTF